MANVGSFITIHEQGKVGALKHVKVNILYYFCSGLVAK